MELNQPQQRKGPIEDAGVAIGGDDDRVVGGGGEGVAVAFG